MFSTLLYNLWVVVNSFLSIYLFGEQVDYMIMTAKMFMRKFYEAYTDCVTRLGLKSSHSLYGKTLPIQRNTAIRPI